MPNMLMSVDAGAITSEMLEPIIDTIVGNIAVIVPVGIVIFGIMISLSIVPKLFRKFSNG